MDHSTHEYKSKLEDLSDWIRFYDYMDARSLLTDTLTYIPYVFVNFYRCLASAKRPTLEFPKMDYEAYMAKKSNEDVVKAWWNGLDPKQHCAWGSSRRILLECLPFLLRMIAPDLKSVIS